MPYFRNKIWNGIHFEYHKDNTFALINACQSLTFICLVFNIVNKLKVKLIDIKVVLNEQDEYSRMNENRNEMKESSTNTYKWIL